MKAILHLLRHAGFTLGLLCLLALFHLVTLGLPTGIARQVTDRIRRAGIPLQADGIRLSPRRGWIFKDARLYSPSPDDLKPLLQTKGLSVFLWPDTWLRPAKGGWHISLYATKCEVSLGHSWDETLSSGSPFSRMERIDASLHIEPDLLVVKDAELQWGGIQMHASGQAELAKRPAAGPPRWPDMTAYGMQAAQYANILQQFEFAIEPEIGIRFRTCAETPQENSIDVTCSAEGMLWNNRTYDRIDATLTGTSRQVAMPLLQIAQMNGERLTARGSFDITTQLAGLSMENSLRAEDLLALFPPPVQDVFARLELRYLGPVEVNVDFGPAPLPQLLEKIHADVLNAPMNRKDLTLDPLRLKMVRDGNRLTVTDAAALANGGPVEGTFCIDLDSLAWDASISGTARPGPVGTLLGGNMKAFIDRFRFPNDPPTTQVLFSHDGTKGSFKMKGVVSAEDFFCSDVPVETLRTDMAWQNGQLILDRITASHNEEKFAGDVQINFANSTATFSATNSFNPRSLDRIISPGHPIIPEQFTFNGPVDSLGEGTVDFGSGTNNAFRGTLRADQLSVDKLQLDRVETRVEGTGAQLLFTNTTAQLYEGQAEGFAEFDLAKNDTEAPYRIQLDLVQVNLAAALQQLSTNDHSRTKGLLSGSINFTADAGAGFWESVKGRGRAKVEKGHLGDIPLFSGLSRLIQAPFPGFNLFSISTFSADFTLGGGKLRSDNIELGGTLISAKAQGIYSPETGFNVKLRAEPLRNIREDKEWYQLHLWGAEVLKKGTSPLFGLFDVSLEGTLENPQWRLLAVPKELYGITGGPAPEKPGPRNTARP